MSDDFERVNYLESALSRRLRAVGVNMDEERLERELAGTKFASGWDESFSLEVPGLGQMGIGPNGELSGQYRHSSNEFWAGHSATQEKQLQLEKFLHHPRIEPGPPTSMWDMVSKKIFHHEGENVSAHVGGVMDEETRLKSDWVNEELPELLKNSRVKRIHFIDDVTGHTTTIDRRDAIAIFERQFKQEDYQELGQKLMDKCHTEALTEMAELEASKASAASDDQPWIEGRMWMCSRELEYGLKDYALRQFAADLDGSRVYIARQDLEGKFTKPEQPDELRKWSMCAELQEQGAVLTTLEAPRHGLTFEELHERATLQRELDGLRRSINRDLEQIFHRKDDLTDKTDPNVREERKRLAAALISIHREADGFIDLVSLSAKTQMELDLERRSVLGDAINTDTELGRKLQKDAYLASQIQTATDDLLVFKRAEQLHTEGQAKPGEAEFLEKQIKELRKEQVELSQKKVDLGDLDPLLRERFEATEKAREHSSEVHSAMTDYFRKWRVDRGVLGLDQGHSVELDTAPFKEKFQTMESEHKERFTPELEEDLPKGKLPILNPSQRKQFAQSMHVLTYEIIGTVVLNILPAASAAVDTGLAMRDANTWRVKAKAHDNDELGPVEKLEAKWEAKMAKWHVIQEVSSAGAALIPVVGIPATMAMGLANMVYDVREGAKLEKAKQTLMETLERPVWRKPSDRLPEVEIKVKGEKENKELSELIEKGKARNPETPFNKEYWSNLLDQFHGTKTAAPTGETAAGESLSSPKAG